MLDIPEQVGGGLQPQACPFHSCRDGHHHPRWEKGKWGRGPNLEGDGRAGGKGPA